MRDELETEYKTTSTSTPSWQSDCVEMIAAGEPFKILKMKTKELREFLELIAAKHHWSISHDDGVAVCFPEKKEDLKPRPL